MTDDLTTTTTPDDLTPYILSALEDLLRSIRENGEELNRGLAAIAASVTGPNVGA